MDKIILVRLNVILHIAQRAAKLMDVPFSAPGREIAGRITGQTPDTITRNPFAIREVPLSMKHVSLASVEHATTINALRIEEYKRSTEFALLDPALISWDATSDQGYVLAAWDNGQCVATMQGLIVRNTRIAEQMLECHLPGLQEHLPALLLTRAATSYTNRRSGLNSVLRYYFLEAAKGVRSVIGTVYAGAPRTKLMATLGYQFDPVSEYHIQALTPSKECWLAHLQSDRIASALVTLQELAKETMAEYPWRGSKLSYRLSDL